MSAPDTCLARLRPHARPARVLGLALLLLWAQWAGLVHRLEHASRLQGMPAFLAAAVVPDHGEPGLAGPHAGPAGPHAGPAGPSGHSAGWMPGGDADGGSAPAEAYHSCVLFDGLHMADALPAVLAPLPAFTQARDAPRAARFASWRAPCTPPFLSRGPPLA